MRKKGRDVLTNPKESERGAVLAYQIQDVRDEDGFVWIFDLTRRQYRTVGVNEAFELCMTGRASLSEPRVIGREMGTAD